MRQICRELWVENRLLGMGIGKLCLLWVMLFGGLILQDYPYSIIGMLMLTSLELTVLKLQGQIDYILPQTSEEKKRVVIIKSAMVAGLYSTINTASYVWLVCRRPDYHWDWELVLFFVYMTVVLFLYYFSYRAGLFCVGSNQIPKPEDQLKRKWVQDSQTSLLSIFTDSSVLSLSGRITLDVMASLSSIFTCLFYIIFKFGRVGVPAVLVRHGMGIMLVLGGITFVLDLRMAVNCIKEMDFSEYMEEL